MTTDSVNYLSIGLMLVSAGAAFVMPFELFLFAYAVLGPLHYLTEISWLHDRGYFLKQKYDYLFPALLAVALILASRLVSEPYTKGETDTAIQYTAFAGVAILLLVGSTSARMILVALVVLSFFVAQQMMAFRMVVGVFLPTLIHVYVFTAAFILIGALRGKSRSGLASLAIFAICTASFFVYAPDSSYRVGHYVRQSYASFEGVNQMLIRVLNLAPVHSADDLYRSPSGLIAMRFIAFAYLYHYLNWFSKTSIIKWNRISRERASAIIGLWLASMAVYAYSYRIGFLVLLFLSMLHVFLEFPLDQQTFVNAGRELYALARGSAADAPVDRATRRRALRLQRAGDRK
jgi:hypothetical protein